MMNLQMECGACHGTGVYVGFAERNGFAVVCDRCQGTGEVTTPYVPFAGRKRRENVVLVGRENGCYQNALGKHGPAVTYEEFLAGKFPEKPVEDEA